MDTYSRALEGEVTESIVVHPSIVYLARSPWRRWMVGSGSARVQEGRENIVSEAKVTQEKARRVLQAAAVEANGRPGAYVPQTPVMWRAGVSNPEEFRAIAEYLDERGWIAEADDDYGIFVVTPEGIDKAMK